MQSILFLFHFMSLNAFWITSRITVSFLYCDVNRMPSCLHISVLFTFVTRSMENRNSSDCSSLSGSKGVPNLLRNLKVHNDLESSPSPVSVLNSIARYIFCRGLRPFFTFYNVLNVYVEEILGTSSTTKLEDHPFSTACSVYSELLSVSGVFSPSAP